MQFSENLIFFTRKVYTAKFDISDIDEDDVNPVFAAVQRDEYIGASDDTIIKAATSLSSKYQREGVIIVVIDEASFEDNLVKILVPFHKICGNAYISYRNDIYRAFSIAIDDVYEHVTMEMFAAYLKCNLESDLSRIEERTNIANLF